MKRQFGRFGAFILVLGGLAAPSEASVIGINSIVATDSIDWSQLGGTGATPPSPSAVTTTGLKGASVSSTGNALQRRDQGSGWFGNFAPGASLLHTAFVGPDITITFGTPVKGAGAQIQSNAFGAFTAEVRAFDSGNSLIGTYSRNGLSNNNGDNSAIFIGLLSDLFDIKTLVFVLTAASQSPNDFAIDDLLIGEQASDVPLPGAVLLLASGLGVFGIAGVRRRRTPG